MAGKADHHDDGVAGKLGWGDGERCDDSHLSKARAERPRALDALLDLDMAVGIDADDGTRLSRGRVERLEEPQLRQRPMSGPGRAGRQTGPYDELRAVVHADDELDHASGRDSADIRLHEGVEIGTGVRRDPRPCGKRQRQRCAVSRIVIAGRKEPEVDLKRVLCHLGGYPPADAVRTRSPSHQRHTRRAASARRRRSRGGQGDCPDHQPEGHHPHRRIPRSHLGESSQEARRAGRPCPIPAGSTPLVQVGSDALDIRALAGKHREMPLGFDPFRRLDRTYAANKAKSQGLVAERIDHLRSLSHAELTEMLDENVHDDVELVSGLPAILETQVFWDSEPHGDVRVAVDVWSPDAPNPPWASDGFIRSPDGSVVGE